MVIAFTIQIAASHAREPSMTSSKPASSRVAQMLNVRNVVRSLPALHSAIQHSKSHLLKIISNVHLFIHRQEVIPELIHLQMLSDDRISNIEKKVSESLNEDASSSKVRPLIFSVFHLSDKSSTKKGGLGALNMRVYAVKVSKSCTLCIATFCFDNTNPRRQV
jgi:DNA mismatch repair protein MSH4